MNSPLVVVGIIAVVIGFIVMAIHPRQRGGFRARGSSASGPTWFVLVVLGIFLMAVGAYLPG